VNVEDDTDDVDIDEDELGEVTVPV